jgi:hypothetical protein
LRDFNIKPPQKNKGASQKNQNKSFIKKRITKCFVGWDPMNEFTALFVTSKIEVSNSPILKFKVLQNAFKIKKLG